MYKDRLVPDGGQKLVQNIPGAKLQTGSVDAGMAAYVFAGNHIFVYQKLHPVFFIVHEAQEGDGSGCEIQ